VTDLRQSRIISKPETRALLVSLLFFALLSCGGGTEQKFTTCGSGGSVPESSNPLNISRTPCSSGSPAFARANGVLYVAWLEPDVGNGDIFFSRSTNGGITFSTAVNLSFPLAGNSGNPSIAADGTNVYVMWEELTGGSSTEVYLERSTDSGVTFDAPAQISKAAVLTTGATSTHSARSPVVAAIGTTIWVAWEENVYNIADPTNVLPVQSEILVSYSPDGGVNFQTLSKGISRSSNCSGGTVPGMFSHFPSLAVSTTNHLYAVWQENTQLSCTVPTTGTLLTDIFFSQSASSTPTTFATPKSVAQVGLRKSNASFGVVAATNSAGGDVIYVAWSELLFNSSNTEIFYNRSIDGGATFFPSPVSVLLDNNLDFSLTPSLAISGENLIVVWNEARPDIQGIVAVRSTNAISGSQTTIFPKGVAVANVSQTNASASLPKVLLNFPTVYLVWVDSSPGNPEIVFRSFPF
jgi:hypothetical protein